MRPRLAVAAAGALVVVAALGACSKNTGSNSGSNNDVKAQKGGIGNAAQSKGPAPKVAGAKNGGTIYLVQEQDFEHPDPQRIYVNNAQVFAKLYSRQLTTYVDDGKGNATLVGDLATDPGTDVSGGKCTSWKFTLKDGLKYEDGSDITAADVAYGVARSFSPDLADGPHYIQQWLADDINYNKTYKGPYNGGAAVPPGVKVSGKTITFDFKSPHCDMPFAAAWGTTTPLPKAKDTKTKLDLHPFSSGPYKFESYQRDSKLVLTKNKYWDANTDPLRHAYPDKFEVDMGASGLSQTNRMIADNGNDQYGIMQGNIDPTMVKKVEADSTLQNRIVKGYTQFVWYLAINNNRVKDLKVRQALNYALDKKAYIQAIGGPNIAEAASTLESPTTIGFKKYDAYPFNVAKAKQLLGGKHPQLVYAYANTASGQKYAPVIKNSLEKAGFKIVLKPIDAANFYTEIGKKNNPYDLYKPGWGSDWPSASTIIPPVFDGRNIQAQGNSTYPYFTNADVNSKIDEYNKLDAKDAAPKWAALDQEIMTKYAPVVPFYYDKTYQLVGSKVGGVYLGASSGWPEYTNAFAK
ncbi:ABC transporter substrate-binding protein [Actinocatenispora rupis]|uniref:ABC transporter n=1 Tax=Actinocatenispora rupis TaxID=519421 RepID=A0A8J3NDQ3_9ACTN|nr:ABC transporter substrate-binding protein [Actinocatenispora rupis]GID11759.1 ABC transporter [Actinocatenispora rupis]